MMEAQWTEGNDQKTVAIIGLGYVGLPLALRFVKKGFRVLGIDLNSAKIEMLHRGKSYIHEIKNESILYAVNSQRFLATSQHSAIQAADAIIICVPTPLTDYGTPDLSYLTQAAAQIALRLKKGHLVVLESSTYPGTTREVLIPLLSKSGLKAGEDFFVAYSPERGDPGNKRFPLERIPKIVSGMTPRCLAKVKELYSGIFSKVHSASTTDAAEMTKIVENAYRLVNISFINEMAMICDRLNLNIWEVIDAAGTKPFGFMPFYPGPGIGGHNIPVDPSYLLWKVKQYDMNSELIRMSNAINHKMPLYVSKQLKNALAPNVLSSSSILVYGAAYKRDIEDYRGSASIDLMKLLRLEGAKVYYHDPYIPKLFLGDGELESVELDQQRLADMDAVVIATDHTGIPVEFMLEHAKLIYDTRNSTKGKRGKAKVLRLGAGNI